MSLQEIQDIIPSRIGEFEKLIGDGEPCFFDGWRDDRRGNLCLYYGIPSNQGYGRRDARKRVPVSEMCNAHIYMIKNKIFDRNAYKNVCPIAFGDGACGFAVVGRILEEPLGARYEGNGRFHLAWRSWRSGEKFVQTRLGPAASAVPAG